MATVTQDMKYMKAPRVPPQGALSVGIEILSMKALGWLYPYRAGVFQRLFLLTQKC